MSFTFSRRDLATAVGARSLSMLGNEVAAVALSLRVLDAGGRPWVVAALLAAALVPMVVFAAPAGRLVDRVDSRRLLLAGGSAQTLSCVALAAVPATSPAAVLGLVIVLGALEAVVAATWQALLPELVPAERLAHALGLAQAGSTATVIAAPPLAGLLSGWFGTGVALLLDAATYLAVVAGALLIGTHRRPVVHTGPADANAGDTRGGFGVIARDTILAPLAVLLGLFVTLTAMVNVVDVFLVRHTLGASSLWFGLVGGLWGVGLFTGSLLGARVAAARMQALLVASSGGLALALGAQSLVPSVGWLVPCSLLGGLSNGTLNVASQTLVMSRAPRSARGRVGAAITGIVSAGLATAYVAGGALSTVLSPRVIFAAAGVAGLLVLAGLARPLLRTAASTPGDDDGDSANDGDDGASDGDDGASDDGQAPPDSQAAKASKEYGRPRKSATRSAASPAPPLASTASR